MKNKNKMDRYQGDEERLFSDKNCWQDVAFRAHLKIVQLQNELKRLHLKHEEELKGLQLKLEEQMIK